MTYGTQIAVALEHLSRFTRSYQIPPERFLEIDHDRYRAGNELTRILNVLEIAEGVRDELRAFCIEARQPSPEDVAMMEHLLSERLEALQ